MGEDKKFRGLDIKTLTYFVDYGKVSWKINPDGHLPKYADQIKELDTELESLLKKTQTGKLTEAEATVQLQGLTRKTLEISLLPTQAGNPKGFDYDKALEKYGTRTLDGISGDMRKLFLVYGGVEELKLLKVRLKEGKQSGYIGIEG